MEILNSLSEKEIREYLYKQDLCYLIDQEIYAHYNPAKKGNWRLGKLHQEWNELLKNQGIVIEAPRDHLKSFFFCEAYPLEKCEQDDDMTVLIIGSSTGLANKRLDHIKKFASLPRWKHLLKNADIDSRKQVRFSNGAEIETTGFGGKVRSGHYKLIILDDPIDSQVIYSEDWNKKTRERLATEILPMAEPDTQIIIDGTIQKDGDLYSVDWGSLKKDIVWVKRVYDAIVSEEKHLTLYPEKWTWEKLMAKMQEIVVLTGDDKFFLKEYRNMKVDLIGEIVKSEEIMGYDILPEGQYKALWGWDLAVGKKPDKGDYTAGIHLKLNKSNGNIFIDKIVRKRIDFDGRLKEIVAGYQLFPETIRVAVEEVAFQYDSVQTLKKKTNMPIMGVKTTKNKIEKFNEMLKPLFGNRKVFIKNGIENRQEFISELTSLPRGKHDDCADSLCLALHGIEKVAEPNMR